MKRYTVIANFVEQAYGDVYLSVEANSPEEALKKAEIGDYDIDDWDTKGSDNAVFYFDDALVEEKP